jgi:hypothetical protein
MTEAQPLAMSGTPPIILPVTLKVVVVALPAAAGTLRRPLRALAVLKVTDVPGTLENRDFRKLIIAMTPFLVNELLTEVTHKRVLRLHPGF